MEINAFRLGLFLIGLLAIGGSALVIKNSFYNFRADGSLVLSVLMVLLAEVILGMGMLILSSLAIGKPWSFY